MIRFVRTKKIKTCKRIKNIFTELYKNRILTFMILPAILYVLLFSYIPMAGIVIAFKQFTYSLGIFKSAWIGFENFEYLFVTGVIYRVTFNTIAYNLAFIAIDIFLQISVAVILAEITSKYFKKVSQTILLLPFFVSWVVAGAIVYNILSYKCGVINSYLTFLGYDRFDFMNTPSIWPVIFVIFHAWKNLGYGTVVYLSAITSINPVMYEAAAIDGANIFQRIFRITLPNLKPTAIILVLLALGKIVKGDFAMFYNLTGNNAMLLEVSDIIDTFVYRSLIQTQNFGMSAAAGVYQSLLGFTIIMSVNAIVKKMQPEYALF